jgi:hypothetical protein
MKEINMTAIDYTPVNKNFLSPLGFKFQIKKLPNVNFFVQNVNIPGLAMGGTPKAPNPFVAIPYSGEHLLYNEFKITFKVDEDLKNFLEIHYWLRGLGFPEDFKEYGLITEEDPLMGGGLKSEASLMITTNGKSPNIECIFEDAFPVSLSDLEFNTTDNTVDYIEVTATFAYTQYKISAL